MDNNLNVEIIDNQQLSSSYGYIYLTTNLINNKIYIGKHKSTDFDKNYYGSGKIFVKALKKYGKENFKVEVLQICNSEEQLNKAEKYWINEYRKNKLYEMYNLSDGGEGGCMYNYSEEAYNKAVKKLSNTRKNTPLSDKQLQQINDLHISNTGKHHSEE